MPVTLDKAKYGASEHGNFYVHDTIGVPHPYCITAKHVEIAADDFGGMLGKEAIEAAERKGAKCGICRGKLSYKQHETALLVACKKDLKDADGKADPELHAYLQKIVAMCEADGYAGFAFVEAPKEPA